MALIGIFLVTLRWILIAASGCHGWHADVGPGPA